MECVILFRNPSNRSVGFISKDDGDIAVFPNDEAAVKFAESHFLAEGIPISDCFTGGAVRCDR